MRVGGMRAWEEGPQAVARSSGGSRLVASCPLPNEFHPHQEVAISRGLTLGKCLWNTTVTDNRKCYQLFIRPHVSHHPPEDVCFAYRETEALRGAECAQGP